jgi:hypothetical protein
MSFLPLHQKNKEGEIAYFIFEKGKVFYRAEGHGAPPLLLHGNTASSDIYDPIHTVLFPVSATHRAAFCTINRQLTALSASKSNDYRNDNKN